MGQPTFPSTGELTGFLNHQQYSISLSQCGETTFSDSDAFQVQWHALRDKQQLLATLNKMATVPWDEFLAFHQGLKDKNNHSNGCVHCVLKHSRQDREVLSCWLRASIEPP